MIKWSLNQDQPSNPKFVSPSNRAAKYKKQKLKELKGELDESTVTVGDLSTPFAITERTT